MTETTAAHKRRWYRLSPDRLIVGLLAVQILLLMSAQFQWFPINERKGWTVVIAVAAVCLAVVVMLLWLAASLLFRWRFQFSLRSLVVLVVAAAVPLGWFGMKMREAERQRQAVDAIRGAVGKDGEVWYEFHFRWDESTGNMYDEPPAPAWLIELIGKDLFSNVAHVILYGPKADNALSVHLKGLTGLETLTLTRTQITDTGLENVKGLTELQTLTVRNTRVTKKGIDEVRKALPDCCIDWDGKTADPKQSRTLTTPTKGRRFRFSLKTLLIAVVLLSVPLGWLGGCLARIRQQRSILEHLDKYDPIVEWRFGYLVRLGFHGAPLTDAELKHIKGLTELRHLYFEGTRVTEQGINRLRKALPKCRIVWDGELNQPPTDQEAMITPRHKGGINL